MIHKTLKLLSFDLNNFITFQKKTKKMMQIFCLANQVTKTSDYILNQLNELHYNLEMEKCLLKYVTSMLKFMVFVSYKYSSQSKTMRLSIIISDLLIQSTRFARGEQDNQNFNFKKNNLTNLLFELKTSI